MQTLFEKHVAENYAITAFALYAACRSFRESTTLLQGLNLQQTLLLPAMIFHAKTAESFANRTRTEGLFYRVLAEQMQLTVGLQDRMQDFADRTLSSIHFGVSVGLLVFQKQPEFQICAAVIRKPSNPLGSSASDEAKRIIKAADRLGYCFATTDFPIICASLRVSF